MHQDGSLVLWSLTERKALCKLELPQSFAVHNALCIFSGNGDYAFIAGTLCMHRHHQSLV